MTPRAIETLKSVSLIAAEDTRVTQKLLSAFDIHTPLPHLSPYSGIPENDSRYGYSTLREAIGHS